MNYLTLDEVKKIELDILIQFDTFCRAVLYIGRRYIIRGYKT